MEGLDYLLQALNYYYHANVVKQQQVITENRIQFEYQEHKNDQQGINHSLSMMAIQRIPLEIRDNIHSTLVLLMNRQDFHLCESDKSLLISTLAYHQTKLPNEVNNTTLFDQDSLLQWVDKLGDESHFKLIELVVSSHSSVVYNVISLLQAIYKQWGDVGLADFNHCFLSPAIHFSSLAQPDNQKALAQLLHLSAVEYHWWQQLTLQHVEQSGFADFGSLMAAFQHFLNELKIVGLGDTLPMPCPLQDIVNLPVDLNRVVSLLRRAKKPSEQFNNLMHLDWSAGGVICASQDINYQFISADMQLNLDYEAKFNQCIIKHGFDTTYHPFSHYKARPFSSSKLMDVYDAETKAQFFEFTTASFFRYIGCQPYAAPMPCYQHILNLIALPDNYNIIKEVICISRINDQLTKDPTYIPGSDVMVLNYLPAILAYATTGRRALDRWHDQNPQQIKLLIAAIYECARERCFDHEMDEFLLTINAVSYEKLKSLLKYLSDLNSGDHLYRLHDKDDERLRLDLYELTLILHSIKQSIDDYYDHLHRHPEMINEITHFLNDQDSSASFRNDWWGQKGYQLFTTQSLFEKYPQYFIDAMHRIEDYNQKSFYPGFIIACESLEKHAFSFENKGRLMRILSLVHFQIESLTDQLRASFGLLNDVALYQEKFGTEGLDHLLSTLSCLVPYKNNGLEVNKIASFIGDCSRKLENDEVLDIPTSVSSCFSEYRIDPYLVDVTDTDFYTDPSELELKYPGLGQFFTPIKAIVLQGFPVARGDNKLLAWQTFLNLIHPLNSSEKQHQLVQMLVKSNHQNVDLNTLTRWLQVILKQSEYRSQFHPDYFNLLHTQLLLHPYHHDFTNVLDKWLHYSDWYSPSQHKGFISLLNKLASIDQGFLCLESLYKAARSIAWLSHHDDYPWYDDVLNVLNTWQKLGLEIASLEEILAGLDQFCEMEAGLKQDHSLFKQALLKWLSTIEQTFELTLQIFKQWDSKDPKRSFNVMLILSQASDIDLKHVHAYLMKMNQDQLERLATCYQSKPLPSSHLLSAFIEDRITLEAMIAQHHCDPHQERDETKLKQQFNDEILWPYVNRAKQLQTHLASDLPFQQPLYAQLKFMNHIGREEIRQCSLNEIRQRLHDCRDFLSRATSTEEKITAHLTALSLVREAVYKTSHAPAILWPSAVQMLGLLSAINHASSSSGTLECSPLFMQMATGEGKSLLAVFLAILTWLKDDVVTIVTHRASLASRDALAYAPLFNSLGIPCTYLTADRYRKNFYLNLWLAKHENKPEFDGIYYIEFNDLALIRQQRLLNIGRDIDEMSFIIDEADETILHNQTDNNLTQMIGTDDTHPHAWVFVALSAYLEGKDPCKETLTVKLVELVDYLRSVSPLATRVCQDIEFLRKLPVYLQAAWQALTLTGTVDFIAKRKSESEDDYYAAVLLNDKPMPPNVTFNGLIQQALHGRLNHEAKKQQSTRHFPIAPESTLFTTMNPEAHLQWMKESGAIIALSATIGSSAERIEMQQHYGFDYIKLPKMQSSLRVDYPVEFCVDQHQQLKSIALICENYTGERTQSKSRTILIVVESIDLAERLNRYLRECSPSFNPYVLHAGLEDLSDETLGKLEIESGQSGHILIALGGFVSRGFDIKLSSAKQVVVISTYLKDGVDEIQVKGRAGRVNQATGSRDQGKFYAVYDLEKECGRYPGLELTTNDIEINPEIFKQKQYFAHYQQASALRLHKQLTGISKHTLQQHFFVLWITLFKTESVNREMRDKIMSHFTESLEKIVSLVPVDDFSVVTEKSIKARRHYNHCLLSIYEECLLRIQSALPPDFIVDVNDIISSLSRDMERQQHQLINDHYHAVSTGADHPDIKIYKQWKKGVKFNAYLDPGKQGFSNYLTGMVNTLWLSKENKEKLSRGKSKLEEKIARKNEKKSDFISQLNQVMKNVNSYKDLFTLYNHIYDHLIAPQEKSVELPLAWPYYNPVDDNETSSTTKRYVKKQAITFMNDPMIGKPSQITLTSHTSKLFVELQMMIDEVYKSAQITVPLKFVVTTLDEEEPYYYRVLLDFSGHEFDSINRRQLLTSIASHFDVNVDHLFEADPLPSYTAMQTVLMELRDMMKNHPSKVNLHFKAVFQRVDLSLSRHEYYQDVFKTMIALYTKYYHELDADMKCVANALFNYTQSLSYFNHSEKLCTAYAPRFENLSTLLENDKKRMAMDAINKHINLFNKNSFSDALLCRQQVESLIQLGMQIIHSKNNESLHSLYEKWHKKPIQYHQQDKTVYELMHLREESSTLFMTSRSPDGSLVCRQLEEIIGDKNNHFSLHKTPIENRSEITLLTL